MGGAIFNQGGLVTITNSTFANNNAVGGEGESFFFNNSGCGFGGAIFNLNGTVNIASSTLAGNTVASGAANGGALYNLAYDSATARTATAVLVNSILAGTTGGMDLVNDQPANTSAGTNLSSAVLLATEPNIVQSSFNIGGVFTNSGVIAANPLLGPLTDNGGATATMALLPGSPAANAGDADLAPATDQRGAPRLSGTYLDLGALQFQAGSAPSVLTSYGFATPGQFRIQFAGNTGAGYTVLTATNLGLPFSEWTVLGAATQISNGLFQFIEPQPASPPVRFYRVRQP
jgi:hypothetical protein